MLIAYKDFKAIAYKFEETPNEGKIKAEERFFQSIYPKGVFFKTQKKTEGHRPSVKL